jgi:hypothetical protein
MADGYVNRRPCGVTRGLFDAEHPERLTATVMSFSIDVS